MKFTLEELKKVKGIGPKIIERLLDSYESEYDNNFTGKHLPVGLHLGDCLDIMKNIENESIDMILTDPPYMIDYRSNRRVIKDKFDVIVSSENLIKHSLEAMNRVLKNNSAIYMFCSWHNVDLFKQEFEKYFKLKNILVWNKNNHGSGDLKGSYAPKHELILFGHKGRALNKSKRLPDVINVDKIPSNKLRHPTEKPTELLDIFIKNNSDIGDIILDPFMGVGTTIESARELDRRYIGIEIEKQYFDIAVKGEF